MNKILYITITLLLLNGVDAKAQKKSAMDKISAEACECLEKDLTEEETEASLKSKLSMCIMQTMMPYYKDFEKEIEGKDEDAMKAWGIQAAARLMQECPSLTHAVMKMQEAKKLNRPEPSPAQGLVVSGTISEIREGQFYTLIVEDDSQKAFKILMMEDFKNSEKLLGKEKRKLEGKEVKAYYYEADFYNPVIQDYIPTKILTGVEML